MTAWLLKNWLPLGLSATLTAVIAFGLHTLAVDWIEASYERKLTEQKTVLTQQCEAAKATTEEVSRELQTQLSVRDASLADARRLLNKQCAAPVVVHTAARHDGSTAAGELRVSDGSRLEADGNELLDIAGDAEAVRLRLIACQSFVEKNRAARLNQ